MDEVTKIYALAEYDAETQQKLDALRAQLIKAGFGGEQTAGIPHHITLGAFPLSARADMMQRLAAVPEIPACETEIASIDMFGDRVLFLSPRVYPALSGLHAAFDDGFGDWVAHTTMFLSDIGGAAKARDVLAKIFTPFTARIEKVELYEFFPSRHIAGAYLKDAQP